MSISHIENVSIGQQLYDRPQQRQWIKSIIVVGTGYVILALSVMWIMRVNPVTIQSTPTAGSMAIEIASMPTAPKEINNLNDDMRKPTLTAKTQQQKEPPPKPKNLPVISAKQENLAEITPVEKPLKPDLHTKSSSKEIKEKNEINVQQEEETLNKSQKMAANNSAERAEKESDKAKAPEINNNASQQKSVVSAQWEDLVLAKLQKLKRYPAYAQRMKQQDVIMVKFTVDSEGKLLSYHIEQSQKFELLDREALALIQRAAPFPIPPQNALSGNQVEIVVPIEFSMKG